MVGIIILNYNNTRDVILCVESVLKYSDIGKIRIVVVDNGSDVIMRDCVGTALSKLTDDFKCVNNLYSETFLPLISYLELPQNLGYATGNNMGLSFLNRFSKIEHIMILNSDVLFTSNIIDPLVEKISVCKNVGAISPLLYRPNGDVDYCCARSAYDILDLTFTFSFLFSSIYERRIRQKQILLREPELIKAREVVIDFPSGSCMLFEKSVLNEIDGFDPNTFLYYEEAILYEKLKVAGRLSFLIPGLSCIHTGGATTTSTKTSYFLKQCNLNSLVYYMKAYLAAPISAMLYVKVTGYISLFVLWLIRRAKHIIDKITFRY